jgi:type I restriction enzyme M protein
VSTNIAELNARLWEAADSFRANSKLKSSEYAVPVLGLIFLKYADQRFSAAELALASQASSRRGVSKTDYQARGVMFLPPEARYPFLLDQPEGTDLGKLINEAMKAIEAENEDLRDVLPKSYNRLENSMLVTLLRNFNSIPSDIEGDLFGKIYEYFLGKFARAEGQKGGEFFTPTSIVKLIVEIIQPFKWRIFDPACGSGGMFVQSARFVANRRTGPMDTLAIYGEEKTAETIRLAKMNLAVNGLAGDIRDGNSYYQDIHRSVAKFDYVMANPPFNVNQVDKERIKDDPRLPFGLPKADNANYIWIQLFYSALADTGRSGFVMANSAGDARGSEQEIRQKLIESGAVDVIVSVSSNFFLTVTLPCTLWFFDKAKAATPRKNQVQFLDARHIYIQTDRAHREFTPQQVEFLANVVRLYRGEAVETPNCSSELLKDHFPDGTYTDVAGLCKVATIDQIEAQGRSLNPGRYVGVTERAADEFDFAEKLEELNEELEVLNAEAHELEERIAENISKILSKDYEVAQPSI